MDKTKFQFALYFLVATLLVIFLSFGTIQSVELDTDAKEYSGLYSREFEAVHFIECGSDENWWANTDPEIDYDIKMKYLSRKNTEVKYIFVRVKGVLSEIGKFGHFGMSERELNIQEILESGIDAPVDCFDWD